MTRKDTLPHLPGILTTADLARTAESIEALQLDNGMIPWFPGGHCDPWNHVETAMALDVMGRHDAARRAYLWLAETQRPDGSWHNYYLPDGTIEDPKLDSNVVAYVAAGVWHHWLCGGRDATVDAMWPVVRAALDWVIDHVRHDGTVLWAREVDDKPWDYALLTGCASIRHALHCGAALGSLLDDPQPRWRAAADAIDTAINHVPGAFEPKDRWAMDWYYPVLTGATVGAAAKARLASGWDSFVLEDRGVRCVSDEQWVTAAETAECAIAHCAVGDRETARQLLMWTISHRADDGSYYTGVVYPSEPDKRLEHFPAGERSAYTAAAVILAADAIAAPAAASAIFTSDAARAKIRSR